MKLLAMAACLACLTFGIAEGDKRFGIAGAAIYLSWVVFDGILMTYFEAKHLRRIRAEGAPHRNRIRSTCLRSPTSWDIGLVSLLVGQV